MTWVTAPVARAGNEGLSGMDAQFGALTVPFKQDHGCARMGGSCAEEGLKIGGEASARRGGAFAKRRSVHVVQGVSPGSLSLGL